MWKVIWSYINGQTGFKFKKKLAKLTHTQKEICKEKSIFLSIMIKKSQNKST